MCEQLSSKSTKRSKALSKTEADQEDDTISEDRPISEKQKKSVSIRVSEREGAESYEEDATEAESVTEEEEPLHDGYAFKQGKQSYYVVNITLGIN